MDILNQENTQYDPSEAAVFIHELDSVSNLDLSLPERSPCVAHMLNLIGSKDAFFYVSNDDEFDEMYHQCFSKLKALWNISGRSPKFSSIFKTHVGLSLQKPSQTRWNSTFDSVFFLLNLISNDKLNAIYDAVTEFNENSHGKKFYFELISQKK
ncbi:hypothetical protein PVAND_014435 [Polypedilum vanderplanki]|uniref:Uncharacterized protein n=1 Tax=Polypedilum vanderplanki TaxID=319348 RepID=A0A9J6B9V8_POLVA|nr:hypothetical protein PVAND_014435 [Polypedilum vanderplanki]